MDNLKNMVIIAFLVEAVWETLKMLYDKDKINKSTMGSLIVGLLIATSVGFDILMAMGFESRIPYFGIILTGILISRGGNFVHDLSNLLTGKAKEGTDV